MITENMADNNQGWQCPVCNRVYSPTCDECKHCNETSTTETIEVSKVIHEHIYIHEYRYPYVYPPYTIPYRIYEPYKITWGTIGGTTGLDTKLGTITSSSSWTDVTPDSGDSVSFQ